MAKASRSRVSRRALATAVVLCVGLIAAACGDDGDSGGENGSPPTIGERDSSQTATTTTALEVPKPGGVLAFAEFSEPASLDPIVTTGNGTTGATEMAAVYDTLMRYDPETGEYELRTAESVESSDDSLVWTVKIKPGILFSDGTPYDAEAVAFGLNRHRSGQPKAPPCEELVACPRNTTSSGVFMALVDNIEVVDPLTVRITLNEPWAAFQFALSDEPSMIPSPTELKRVCDPAASIRECSAYGLAPVGAGPFVVDSFVPGEGIKMSPNPNYWDGPVNLDGLSFFSMQDSGGDRSLDALKTGTANIALLRGPEAVAASKTEGFDGHSEFLHGGGLFLFNLGIPVQCTGGEPAALCAGKDDGTKVPTTPPTAELKVRQAIVAAIDPDVIDDRANNGTGLPGNELLQESFRWYPDVKAPGYDPELAKKLVAEAKAEGWDGNLKLLYSNAPVAANVALATEAMLTAAGIAVTVDTSKNTTAQVQQVTTLRDYEMSGWGTSIAADDSVSASLAQNLSSTSPSNRVGYANDLVDQALKDLRAAKSDDEKTAAIKVIMEQVYLDLPYYAWSTIEARLTYGKNVKGLTFNHSSVVFLYDAWLDN